MDTSDPWIRFDGDGHCNHCNDFLTIRANLLNRQEGTGALGQLFKQVTAKGRGKKYDCVIGMSGGVDSSYVAVLAAEQGLRVLAVHLDNGWNSPVAVENINKLVKRLGFGYASLVLPWSDFKKVQVSFLRASVPEAETPTDVAIQRAVFGEASRHGVRYILSGGNLASEGILPACWHYNARDTRYSYAVLDAANCPRKHFSSLKFGWPEEIYYRGVRGIRTLYPLNAINYDKAAARKRLETDFDWKYYGSKHGESKFTRFVQTYYLPKKHGIDYRRATLSSELCLGVVSRTAALEVLSTSPYDPSTIGSEQKFIAKKLGLGDEELEEIIRLPPKYYRDYANDEQFLSKLYDLYRWFYRKPKTSNF
ncbi:MAG: 7-cyano-7-deazaguanine synthase [Myxococcaceae bacterium]|nr:7-cyano-7-deazaguanine synthase [Myxococcaceae bacterium]